MGKNIGMNVNLKLFFILLNRLVYRGIDSCFVGVQKTFV